MAIERCPECGAAPESCLPADPVPLVEPKIWELRCINGHVWERQIDGDIGADPLAGGST